MGGLLRFLGKVGKGAATVMGLVVTSTGVMVSVAVDPALGEIVAAIGAALAVFGIGRKAGATLGK